MKKPTDDDLNLWRMISDDIKPIPKNYHQEPITYKKERPKMNPDYFYPKPIKKDTYEVSELQYREIKGVKIDATIDLHGDKLDHACQRLKNFLTHCQRVGNRLVLVITGKGKNVDGEIVGVLRNEIPTWFKNNPQFVISFTNAQSKDGGEGAFYVRVRKL